MSLIKLIYRNLIYFKKLNLAVVIGTIISVTILTGSFIIGDSVKFSLNNIVSQRLEKTEYALFSGERLFRASLDDSLNNGQSNFTSLLHSKGLISIDGGARRINNVNIYGIKNSIRFFTDTKKLRSLENNEIAINSIIAEKYNLFTGDEIVLRISKHTSIPKDSPIAGDEDETVADRFTIKEILQNDEFGIFGLKSEQIPPFNVFVNLNYLTNLMELNNSANLLLTNSKNKNVEEINSKLKEKWTLEDSELLLLNNNFGTELKSKRIFIDDKTIDVINNIHQDGYGILSYFVNEIKNKKNATPYSFVAGIDKQFADINISDTEIIINNWLAEDLKISRGEEVTLKYYVVADDLTLMTDSARFKVTEIVDAVGIWGDETLMPDFPGLSESESCLDWHPGIPINFDKIRDKDENYWKKYKGTPKAFISLRKAKEIWGNRYGSLTSVRFNKTNPNELREKISNKLDPAIWGIQFTDVKTEGLEASSNSIDFGGLFIGLSFFVIVSSVLLTAMLYHFNIETRKKEIGNYLSFGINQKIIKRIIYSEVFLLSVTGAVIGSLTAVLYDKLVLAALGTIWIDIIGTSNLQLELSLLTIVIGFISAIIINQLVVWLNIRKIINETTHNLQRGIDKTYLKNIKKNKINLLIFLLTLVTAIVIISMQNPSSGRDLFGIYFGVGILLLIAGISGINYFINKIGINKNHRITPNILVLKEIARNKKRSIGLIVLLSSSLFIVFTVGVNKKVVSDNLTDSTTGTGGYQIYAETSVPVYQNLNSEKIRKDIFTGDESGKVKFTQIKIKPGDDASCLNLNRVSNPPVIGINPEEMIRRNSFSFSSISKFVEDGKVWELLNKKISENVIFGIADASVIQWQLGKSVGDTLDYTDSKGKELKIVLAAGMINSIFQGSLIISDEIFNEKFSDISGTNIIVSDGSKNINKTIEMIEEYFVDNGITVSRATERLALFNKVENTYLSIFLLLGSFGILVGTFGIAIVIYRNITDQKNELALFSALGIPSNKTKMLLQRSYHIMFGSAIGIGLISALTASLPSLISNSSDFPWLTLSIILGAIYLTGDLVIRFSIKSAMKENLLLALRNE